MSDSTVDDDAVVAEKSLQLLPLQLVDSDSKEQTSPKYRVYKRRFLALSQLALLNIVISWAWVVFAPVSHTAAIYFRTSEAVINWLATGYLFAFLLATPVTFWVLNNHGTVTAMSIAAILALVGTWSVHLGSRFRCFGIVLAGQLISGLAQPFVLCAPTSFSSTWFSEDGRTTATAVPSLANPLGAALGQLVGPAIVKRPDHIPRMTLVIAILTTIVAFPTFFVPPRPPTPPTASARINLVSNYPVKVHLKRLATSVEFWLIAIPFWIYVGLFNSFTSIVNQVFEPYGHSEKEAGIVGALLIIVGLAGLPLSAPFIDKYKLYIPYVKVGIPVAGLCFAAFIWTVHGSTMTYSYIISSLLGFCCFGLLPVLLELMVELHHPLGPEVSSSICWSGAQMLGAVFIIIQTSMKADDNADPPGNMHKALIFQGAMSLAAIPFPMALGMFGRQSQVRRKRLEIDLAAEDDPL